MGSITGLDLDRCAGVLVGLAAGDALGAGYEFGRPPSGEAKMVGGGLGGWEPGEWTDDTQMALCIAEEAATGDLGATAVAARFLDWYHGGPADVGVQTSAVLSTASGPADVARAAADYFSRRPRNSAGNGSLMRTAPVALACLGDDEALVRRAMAISALTHADPLACEACAIWCVAIDRAVREGKGVLEGVGDGIGLLPEDRRGYWRERVDEVLTASPSSFRPNGFVVRAFQAALAAIVHTPVPSELPCRHLSASLQTAVHIGDDTDTVAAIAGAWLGARWGATAVPARWAIMLHGWPGYRAKDLVRLAVLTARKGSSDQDGWPETDQMISHYAARWPAAPLVQPLGEDDGVLLANVYGVVNARADVTVSLCRMGRRDLAVGQALEVRLVDEDDPAANPNLDFVLKDLAQAVVSWRAQGKTVLVHCVRAERRTPAVAAAFLAERFGVPGLEAFERVRGQLPGAYANRAFSAALARLWPVDTNATTPFSPKDDAVGDEASKMRGGDQGGDGRDGPESFVPDVR